MSDADDKLLPNGDKRTEIHRRVGLAAEVFSKYDNDIRAMIGFNVKDKSRADDMFQSLFISLVHNPVPPYIGDVKAYLYRAVLNDVNDGFRRTKIHQESVGKYAQARKYDLVREDPQESAIETEEIREMFRLLEGRLPKHQAEAVVHRYEKGLSVSDTASQMRLNEKSVRRYLSAARKKIREFIAEKRGHVR